MTGYLRLFRRCSALIARIWALCASRSLLAFRLALILMYVATPPTAIATTATADTACTIDSTVAPIWLMSVLWVLCSLLGTIFFHWVYVPFWRWLGDWWLKRFP